MDTISIVVPVYNCKKYIAKCIRSIQKQTYPNWKLILVDDGSTDGTGELCDRICSRGGDKRISVVHQENKGCLKARLTGIAKASGEFIAFVDADDLVEPEMLQKLLDTQAQYSADIVCCGHKSLSRRGFIKSIDRKENTIIHTSGKEEAIRLAAGMPTVDVFLAGKLYRKNIFLKALNESHLFSDIFVGEDNAMNTAVFDKADKVVIISDKLYLYRTGGNSLNGTEKAMQDLSKLYRYRKNYLLQENADGKYHKSNLAQILNMAVCLTHYSKNVLSRDMICSNLANVIEDMNTLYPDYRHQNAFDLNIPMTDKAFKNIYRESPVVRMKQFLLRIL